MGRHWRHCSDEAEADAAPGVYVQTRDRSKGVAGVVVEADAIRIDVEEAKGRSGWSRVVRGKNQGVTGGAVTAKPRGPVGAKEQPWARQGRQGGGVPRAA